MEDFYSYSLSRQDLNVRAAYTLCLAGWMLAEINGVLELGDISPERFQQIQQEATTLARLQRKFGPPPTLRSSIPSPSTDITPAKVNVNRLPKLRVVNRGIEEAAAVLSHHGWHCSQIHSVLTSPSTLLEDLGLDLMNYRQMEQYAWQNFGLKSSRAGTRKPRVPTNAILLFGLGIMIVIGTAILLHRM